MDKIKDLLNLQSSTPDYTPQEHILKLLRFLHVTQLTCPRDYTTQGGVKTLNARGNMPPLKNNDIVQVRNIKLDFRVQKLKL